MVADANKTFGVWVKQRRIERDLTQAQLADLVACSLVSIKRIEQGRLDPGRDLAELLNKILSKDPEEFDAAATFSGRRPRRSAGLAGPLMGPKRHNLPPQTTKFVGRLGLLVALSIHLEQPGGRLLTLMGPGGVGKTRLAIRLAANLRDQFADGVWFVDLAPVRDPALVATAIATVLEVKETARQSVQATLHEFLENKHLLLILDNFEQVQPAAHIVNDLLAAAPRLQILVTSRAALQLQREQIFPIPALNLPKPADRLSVVREAEAVALFLERAIAVRPDFVLTAENAPTIVAICTRLDGLPLAIELAAVRVRLLPPAALLARLESSLRVLIGGPSDKPSRQQTLRGTISWSYDLLEPSEQILFRRLAVFAGGCTLPAAEDICSISGDLELDILDGLDTLCSKSLIYQTEDPGGEPRFWMLETIREFAQERLTATNEAAAILQQHAAYFLAFAKQANAALRGPNEVVELARLGAEHDNLRAALNWAMEHGSGDLLGRLATTLFRFWERRGFWTEGRQWLEVALRTLVGDRGSEAVQAEVLVASGGLARQLGDLQQAQVFLEQGLLLHENLGLAEGLAIARKGIGLLARERGDYERARHLIESSLQTAQAAGNKTDEVSALDNLALLAQSQGDNERAATLWKQCLLQAEQTDNKSLLMTVIVNLGVVAYAMGNYTEAQERWTRARELNKILRNPLTGAIVSSNLAWIAYARGHYESAHALFEESLQVFQTLGRKAGVTMCYTNLGLEACKEDDQAPAWKIFEKDAAIEAPGRKTETAKYILALATLVSAQHLSEVAVRLVDAAARPMESSAREPIYPIKQDQLASTRCAALGDLAYSAAYTQGQELGAGEAIIYNELSPPW